MKSRTRQSYSQTKQPARHSRQTVSFDYVDPQAQRVCLAGTFNDWRPEVCELIPLGAGHWVKELALLPGTYEYRLKVDGKWITDPNAAHSVTASDGE